ncbi:hypothetical protein V6N13_095438 [Hibiscus sabdariffa]
MGRHSSSFLATVVYTSANACKCRALWACLCSLSCQTSEPWVLIGDFNATLSSEDHISCACSSKPDVHFQNIVFDCGLQDLGYEGSDFTWYKGPCYVRLDRALCNGIWFEYFPHTSVTHLLRMKSDHRPLMLSLSGVGSSHRTHSFKYMASWLQHPDFTRLLHDSWSQSQDVFSNILAFTARAKQWNLEVYGILNSKKRNLLVRLKGVQRLLDRHRAPNLVKLELRLQRELEINGGKRMRVLQKGFKKLKEEEDKKRIE